MYGDIGGAFRLMLWGLGVTIPLAAWKLVDIVIWLAGRITITVS